MSATASIAIHIQTELGAVVEYFQELADDLGPLFDSEAHAPPVGREFQALCERSDRGGILSIGIAVDTSQKEVEQPLFVARDQLSKRGQRLFLGAQRQLSATER